jgi:hypothetical protein
MEPLLIILVLVSAFAAFVAAIFALQAGLKMRRSRIALRSHLSYELTRLTRRVGELEKNLATLDTQAQALPVLVSELQQNLAVLRILTSPLSPKLSPKEEVVRQPGQAKSTILDAHR